MTTVCGAETGFAHGKCLSEAAFTSPYALCVDPLNPCTALYIGDRSSIRYCDFATDTVTLIAGYDLPGMRDGFESSVQFHGVSGLLCSSDGTRLYVADAQNNRIRLVNTQTRMVSTLAGDGQCVGRDGVGLNCSMDHPRKLSFDRSRDVKPESVIFITCDAAIRRLEIDTGKLMTCSWTADPGSRRGQKSIKPRAISSTPSGNLIVSSVQTNAIYLYDPRTGSRTAIAGAGGAQFFSDGGGERATFNHPFDLVVVDHERCCYIADHSTFRVRHMTLPAHLFC